MMREPSTHNDLIKWYAANIGGELWTEDELQCGYYKTRETRDGPWIPCRIFCHQETDPETGELTADETLHLEMHGEVVDLSRRALGLRVITFAEYEQIKSLRDKHAAMHNSRNAIDLAQQPIEP